MRLFLLLIVVAVVHANAFTPQWYAKLLLRYPALSAYPLTTYNSCRDAWSKCQNNLQWHHRIGVVHHHNHGQPNLARVSGECESQRCRCLHRSDGCNTSGTPCDAFAFCNCGHGRCLIDGVSRELKQIGQCHDFIACSRRPTVERKAANLCILGFQGGDSKCPARFAVDECAYTTLQSCETPVHSTTAAPQTNPVHTQSAQPTPWPSVLPTTLPPRVTMAPSSTQTSVAPQTAHAPTTKAPEHPPGHETRRPNDPWQRMHNEVTALARFLPTFRFFDRFGDVYNQCSDAFHACAAPLLRSVDAGVHQSSVHASQTCEREFCTCTAQVPNHDGVCLHNDLDCDASTRCVSNREKCFGRWLVSNVLSKGPCDTFWQCFRDPAQIAIEMKQCESQDSCDTHAQCSFIEHPAGPDDMVPISTGTTPAPPAPAAVANKVVLFAAGAAGLVVLLLGVVVVHSKLKRRRNVVRGPQNLMRIQVQVAEPVRWYGIKQLLRSINSTSVSAPPLCSIPGCKSALGLSGRHMLLPCRCEWCGCESCTGIPSAAHDRPDAHLPDFTVDSRVRAYPGIEVVQTSQGGRRFRTYACRSCAEPIDLVLDLRNMYIEDPDSGSNGSRLDDLAMPKCCVCLSAPVSVVSLPCCHLATCADCASRLCKAVPRKGTEASTVEISSKCPKCRAVCESMVVLGEDQLFDAVAAAHPLQSVGK